MADKRVSVNGVEYNTLNAALAGEAAANHDLPAMDGILWFVQ